MEDYIALCEENAVLESELETLLNLLMDGILTESYINPHGILAYLKAVYPHRYEKRMAELYAQGN